VNVPPPDVWRLLLDPDTLQRILPGCDHVEKLSDTHFRAKVTLGVGPVIGRYDAEIKLSGLDEPRSVTLDGAVTGALGNAGGIGHIRLEPADSGTTLLYDYDARIGGKVASIGGRLLDGAAKAVIRQFFAALVRQTGRPLKRRGFLCCLFGRDS
jgi:2-furoyl-CoA dehydrogenase large subunit